MTGVSAIVLAGGESSRMGQHKGLLNWGGQALVAYQVRSLLAAGAGEVVVVLGYQAGKLRPLISPDPRVRVTVSRRYHLGKTYSIRSGLRCMNPASMGVLIVGVDQPRPPNTLLALIQTFLNNRSSIVVPSYRGKSGHPLIFDASLFRELMRISEETMGLRAVVERHRSKKLLVEMGDPLVMVNLNTPEEYELACRLPGYPQGQAVQ